jgi:hypothetical protein
MANTNDWPGQPNVMQEKHNENEDLHDRSTKKIKGGEQIFSGASTMPKNYVDTLISQHDRADGERSYKEMVIGQDDKEDKSDSDKEDFAEEEMEVKEGLSGEYECPEFVFSKSEEKRIYKPWRRGVIVKLLGRRIGYKALETRLKQMWVRKGVINIIDLGNDYYLVAFTHEEDKNAAMSDGPWFIYDHYLTVREWSPNFHPASDTIKSVAVWIRVSGLPIEYYDTKVLNFIGNRVGKTVKVDKNTLQQERGKYARLCVEVNLTKPLLAMFSIKGRKYHIEYEGLHMLCITCGKFGHYREGCSNKMKPQEASSGEKQDPPTTNGGENNSEAAGPWVVVQKQKRNRKTKEKDIPTTDGRRNTTPGKINADPNLSGSRYVSLSEELLEVNADNNHNEQDMEREDELHIIEQRERENHKNSNKRPDLSQASKGRRGTNGNNQNNSNNGQERSIKESKLATRGTHSFKGRSAPSAKKGVDKLTEILKTNEVEKLMENLTQKPICKDTRETNNEKEGNNVIILGTQEFGMKRDNGRDSLAETDTGHIGVMQPNIPRPPNNQNITPILSMRTVTMQREESVENEVFLDANEQGSNVSSDSDTEMVPESPSSEQL